MAADTPLVERTIRIPKDRVERLRALAEEANVTEDQLVTKALDVLFSASEALSPDEDRRAYAAASEESLARVWDHERDAAYDNWREIYKVRAVTCCLSPSRSVI